MAADSLLLVDDDPDTCASMADIFRELGYEVDVAHDGLAALGLCEHKFYGLALLDYRMPGMDGLELSRCLRATRPDTVVVLVTALAASLPQNADREGIHRVLSKPVDFSILIPLVETAIEGNHEQPGSIR